jgi:predicted small secreted protein
MSFKRLLMATAACTAVAGCNTANKHIGEEDPFLGEAVKYNAAAQIINPDPVYPEGAAEPGSNGDKGANAVKRYRSDQVKQVEMMETTTGSSSGSGSGPK